MAVESNTTTTSQFSSLHIRELDFVTRFENNWQSLLDILGVMRPIRKTPGTQLVSNVASITLANGTVTEGDEVPLSQATVVPVSYADIAFKKYRKRVTAEAVAKYGAAIASQKTDDALIAELTGNVMDDFYAFAQTGRLTAVYSTFQMGVAMAIGLVVDKFKSMHKDFSNVVVFVNTLDLYSYLGNQSITLQVQNGVQYLKNFLGADTMIVSSDIPRNKIIAVPVDNIDLYYLDPADADLKELGLDYTTSNGPTNLIGIHKEGVYGRVSGDTHAIYGMALWAEYIDGIAVVTISTSTSAETATFTSGAGTTAGTKITVTAPATIGDDMSVYVKAGSSAPDLPAYLASVDSTWTKLDPVSGVADNVEGFTAGHKMVMAITNGSGQVIYTSAAAGVTVVNKA